MPNLLSAPTAWFAWQAQVKAVEQENPGKSMDKLPEFIANHPILVLAFTGLVAALIFTEIARRFRGFKQAGPSLATQLINRENASVIDVSPAADFQNGHIVNARNIPLSQLDGDSKTLAKLKGKPVIVCCRAGQTSAQACAKLVKAGFESVYQLTGGIAAWKAENLPVVKGKR